MNVLIYMRMMWMCVFFFSFNHSICFVLHTLDAELPNIQMAEMFILRIFRSFACKTASALTNIHAIQFLYLPLNFILYAFVEDSESWRDIYLLSREWLCCFRFVDSAAGFKQPTPLFLVHNFTAHSPWFSYRQPISYSMPNKCFNRQTKSRVDVKDVV